MTSDFQLLFESAPLPMMVLTPTLHLFAVSDAYCAATLTSRAAIVGRHLFDVFPDNPDDPGAEGVRNLKTSLERVLRTLQPDSMAVQRYDVRNENGSFEPKFWSPQNMPILRDGKLLFILHRVEDVTALMQQKQDVGNREALDVVLRAREVASTSRALKDANDELQRQYEKTRELDQLKTQFFANISHELRTPLALILGPIERLLSMPQPPEARSSLELIDRKARLLLRQVNDLLDASKLEAGHMTLSRAEVDVSQLLRRAASSFESLAMERSMQLRYDAPVRVSAEVDGDRVMQVVLNLLANAFKFTPTGGVIRCALAPSADGRSVAIEIADSGPGIAPEHREVIFERFRQLEGGSKRRFGGTGLGLALARQLTVLHGGTLTVQSAPEGGASFVVELPVKAPAGEAVSGEPERQSSMDERIELTLATVKTAPSPAAASPNLTLSEARPLVLVIEDNVDMNQFITESLSEKYRVVSAFDGRAGLEKARAVLPDLILTDFMMPEMTGPEVVAALRADPVLQRTPVVLLTAKDHGATRVDMLSTGVSDYVIKPFSVAELRARVANLVNARVTERRNEELTQSLEAQNQELSHALSQLEASNKELDAFSYSVSHDLRAPLRVVDGFGQALLEDFGSSLGPEGARYIERIRASTLLMSQLIEDLLRLARVSRAELDFEPVDLVELADELQRELVQTLAPREHPVKFVAGTRRLVRADARLMRVALQNLLANAWKFTAKKSEPRVEVGWVDSSAGPTFMVKDNGAGFDMAYIGRLFGTFQRLHTEKEFPGTGVGLATVQRIATRHGARIWAEATPERGATFYLRFPPDRMLPDAPTANRSG